MLASHGGHVTTAKVLIAAGADVNVDNLVRMEWWSCEDGVVFV